MNEHIGRTGRVGTRHIADKGLLGEQGLEHIALEPLVQVVRHRHGHDLHELGLVFRAELAQLIGELAGPDQIPKAAAEIGRRLPDQIPQHARRHFEHGLEGRVDLRIAGRERCHLGHVLAAVSGEEVPAVGCKRRNQRGLGPVENLQPKFFQLQLANDRRVQQADHVGGDDVAPFQQMHRVAGPGQITRRGQAVVARTDDDDIVIGPHSQTDLRYHS